MSEAVGAKATDLSARWFDAQSGELCGCGTYAVAQFLQLCFRWLSMFTHHQPQG